MNSLVILVSSLWLGYLALELGLYWVPLLAMWETRKRRPPELSHDTATGLFPRFAILSACRDGAVCIPGLVKSFQNQTYPAERIDLYLVADHCTDDSAAVARRLGMTVLERKSPSIPGKGNAVSEMTNSVLRVQPFDYLVVLDIDARVKTDFLERAATYFSAGADLLSFATHAKNPTSSLLARAGDIIQALLRLHQSGRAALGLDAILYGSHGYALSRTALERLDWRTTTGQTAEDMELRLRATLKGLSLYYAADIEVFNDVTENAAAVREQRKRWNATYLPLITQYAGLLMRKAFQGNRRALEALFGLLLLPSFANLFLFISGSLLLFGALSFKWHGFWILMLGAALLWALDLAYFFVAFAVTRIRMTTLEIRALVAHLVLRTAALFESPFHLRAKDWMPAPHSEDL